MKTGRNSPCPCGSGKKYKKCCGRIARTPAAQKNAKAADTHMQLSNAWQHFQAGRYLAAANTCEYILRIDPHNIHALQILSGIHTSQGHYEIAKGLLNKALANKKNNAEIYAQIGLISKKQNNLKDAVFYFSKAIETRPELAGAYVNRANILGKIGDTSGAVSDYKRALLHSPELTLAWTNYLFILNCSHEHTAQKIFNLHKKYSTSFESRIRTIALSNKNVTYNSDKRIRVGYVSPDFREHSVSFFIEPVLALHNHERFEVFGYYSNQQIDATTTRIRGYFDHWRDIHAVPDIQAAELIRNDNIDILVDLSGYTASSRVLVFAYKPAPIQITWIGYPNTTGLSAIDYRITDPVADPAPSSDSLYTENLLRMPDTFLCYKPPGKSLSIAPPPSDENGYITFGSFNNLSKINDSVIEVWAKILDGIPNSKLFLKSFALDDLWVQDRIITRFSKYNIPTQRLILRGIDASLASHLQRYAQIDIALDPFPYNGTTTTCEALWMGVPVISLSGESHRQRVGASILSAIGKHEWITSTSDDYVSAACALAGKPDLLRDTRKRLRGDMSASPFCDAAHFTKNLEKMFRNIWVEACERNKTESGQ